MAILRAEEKHIKGIMEILNESIINDVARFDEEPINYKEMCTWVKGHDEKYPIWVYEIGDKVVGWSCISKVSDKSAYRNTVENSLYIHKDFRGRGIGNELLEELIKSSKDLGYHSIVAVITSTNAKSIKLHKKFGFCINGELKEVGYKFGKWLDVTMMQLIIS